MGRTGTAPPRYRNQQTFKIEDAKQRKDEANRELSCMVTPPTSQLGPILYLRGASQIRITEEFGPLPHPRTLSLIGQFCDPIFNAQPSNAGRQQNVEKSGLGVEPRRLLSPIKQALNPNR